MADRNSLLKEIKLMLRQFTICLWTPQIKLVKRLSLFILQGSFLMLVLRHKLFTWWDGPLPWDNQVCG